jgi:nucleotide-binding universal stress UspA family protein
MRLEAKRILVPVNGTPHSERVFRWGCQMARHSKAALHAVHVIEVPLELPLEGEIAEQIGRGERILSRIETIGAEEKYKGLQAHYLRARQAGPVVVMEAEDRAIDLLLCGVSYKRSFGACVLGATATYILNNASCQVMLWRERP